MLIADKGNDYPRVHDELRRRRVTGYIPRHRPPDEVTPARWVVEQTLSLLRQFRQLATRWEHRTDIHRGFLSLAATLICWRRLRNQTC